MQDYAILIKTERLTISEMLDSDYEECLRLFFEGRSQAVNNLLANDELDKLLRDMTWAEICKDTFNCMIRNLQGQVIGRVCMQHLSETIPELGIDLFRDFQDQGYGTEALSAFIAWYRREHSVEAIRIRIDEDNSRSIHVFEKLGAVYVSTDTFLRQATIEKLKIFKPGTDFSDLETPTVLVFTI